MGTRRASPQACLMVMTASATLPRRATHLDTHPQGVRCRQTVLRDAYSGGSHEPTPYGDPSPWASRRET